MLGTRQNKDPYITWGHLHVNLALQSTRPEVNPFFAFLSRQRAVEVPSCSQMTSDLELRMSECSLAHGRFRSFNSLFAEKRVVIVLLSDQRIVQVKVIFSLRVVCSSVQHKCGLEYERGNF
jgi:hypothetical protein